MMRSPYTRDEGKYMAYYMNQAGGELLGFIGASTHYGRGLGGIFRNLLLTDYLDLNNAYLFTRCYMYICFLFFVCSFCVCSFHVF